MNKMGERRWVKQLLPDLQKWLSKQCRNGQRVDVQAGAKLPYAYEIMGYIDEIADASVTHGYETDLLISDLEGEVRVPRIVIECKLGGVNTHDGLTYSAKAATHKHVHPYLRYGFLIGQAERGWLPPRLIRHGAHFDFMLAWVNVKPTKAEIQRFCYVLQSELEASRQLQRMLRDNRSRQREKFTMLHRELVLH